MIYTVTLNPAIDYVVTLPALNPGEVNRAVTEDYQLGGKGINVSNLLKNLGKPTTALGFVAGAAGAWLEQGLRDSGLATDFVHLKEGMTRINTKIKADRETEVNGKGPAVSEEAFQALLQKLGQLKAGDALVLAGSIPAGLGADTYARMLGAVADRSIETVVDTTGDLLKNALPYHPFLVKPNHHELAQLAGHPLNSREELIAAARELQSAGARNVLVSMAGDGALLLDETGAVTQCPAPKGTVRNSVGAGDSMVAGFLAGWQDTRSYPEALKLAIAAGSASAFHLGLATAEQIREIYLTL